MQFEMEKKSYDILICMWNYVDFFPCIFHVMILTCNLKLHHMKISVFNVHYSYPWSLLDYIIFFMTLIFFIKELRNQCYWDFQDYKSRLNIKFSFHYRRGGLLRERDYFSIFYTLNYLNYITIPPISKNLTTISCLIPLNTKLNYVIW